MAKKAAAQKLKQKPLKLQAKKPAAKKSPAKKGKSAAKAGADRKVGASAEAADSLLKSGDMAPPFSVQNEKGEVVSLKSLRGKKVVLYFYPKDDTPGCTQESCDFRDNFARVKKAGAEVYGVSRDSVKSHEKFKAKHEFPFSLLADEDGTLTEKYGVWQEKNLYGRKYMGIVRTTFLIGEDGRILKVYPKVKVKGHVDQVLEDLK